MNTSLAAIAETNTATDLALGRATIYGALALGFRPPSEETIARLTTDHPRVLAKAATLLDPDHRSKLVSSIEALPAAGKTKNDFLASSYRALFGHTARGKIPPYETEYGHEALFQQPQELSDLMGFYRAFGLTLEQVRHERPDHISCECEFLSFLALKEAYALEHHDTEMLAETRKAQKLFLRDHLGRFVPTFAATIVGHDHAGFYGRLAELALEWITVESSRLEVLPGAMNLSLRPAEDDGVPMACGNGRECAAMPGACSPEEFGSYD